MRKNLVLHLVISGAALAAMGAGAARPQSAAAPTFSRDVAPVLYKNCAGCHRPGEIAPMSLLTYAQARPWAKAMRQRVLDGSMPPWHAEAPVDTFRNERRLTDAERRILVDWADNGAPEGDAAALPRLPEFAAGWTIGVPDAMVSMPRDYTVPPSGVIPYQYFQAPTNFTEDRWVQAIEIRPGARNVVHHVLVYSREPNPVRPDLPFRTVGERERRSGADSRGELIATTAPGTNALVFPAGQALRIKAGSVLTFQVHYTSNGSETRDRSSIGFVFAKAPPLKEVHTGAFVNAAFVIPAGAANYAVSSAIDFVKDTSILAIFPHTHVRGKSWEYRMVYPDGRTEPVFTVPKYNFDWQTYYEFAKPLAAPKGARLEAVAHYDNSANNPFNPDPKANVRWGDQTWEEMQYTGITYVVNE